MHSVNVVILVNIKIYIINRILLWEIFGEFNSVAFRSDKGTLESISGHDDTVSSSFMAINKLRESTVMIKIDAV